MPLRRRLPTRCHGWLPATIQVLTAVALAVIVSRRSVRWRTVWLPAAGLAGLVLTVAARWYIGSFGIAGDPAPQSLWVWIALTGLAVGVLILGWRATQWWRRGASLLTVPMCLLCVALSMNLWVGYFPTVHVAWNQLTAGPLPDQTDRITVTAMQFEGTRPTKGVVVPVITGARASKFKHRRELV